MQRHMLNIQPARRTLEACNNFSDVPAAEKDWVANNLPAKTYKSASEVMEAVLYKA